MGLKYVSIDIETTGLDRQNDQVLEVGAVIEDIKVFNTNVTNTEVVAKAIRVYRTMLEL